MESSLDKSLDRLGSVGATEAIPATCPEFSTAALDKSIRKVTDSDS